jgi:2-polyprenyl-3-methyl-5-hydroxy-6-metoxy-1,4-benzoquinol methylase
MDNNFWNEKYSIEEYFYGLEPNFFLKEMSKQLPKESKILCICEGEGRNAVFLATQGHCVSAVDFSEVAKNKALSLAYEKKVKIDYHVCDLSDFDFGEQNWDVVVSIFAHLHPEKRKKIYLSIIKSLKTKGLFIFEAYTVNQLKFGTGGPRDAELMMSQQILKEEMKGLEWLNLVEGQKNLQEGIGHSGESYTIRGLGIKP